MPGSWSRPCPHRSRTSVASNSPAPGSPRPRCHHLRLSHGERSGVSEPTAPSPSPDRSSAPASRMSARPSPWSSRRPASAFSMARSRSPPTPARAAPSPATWPIPADRQPSPGTVKHPARHRQASPRTKPSSISPDLTYGEIETATDTPLVLRVLLGRTPTPGQGDPRSGASGPHEQRLTPYEPIRRRRSRRLTIPPAAGTSHSPAVSDIAAALSGRRKERVE